MGPCALLDHDAEYPQVEAVRGPRQDGERPHFSHHCHGSPVEKADEDEHALGHLTEVEEGHRPKGQHPKAVASTTAPHASPKARTRTVST